MKTCISCGQNKPLSEFYKHPQMADGHLGKCKECHKLDVKANRAARVEYYRAYDRERADLPHRIAARGKVSADRKADPEKREIDLRSRERWRDRNFVKRRAHIMVGNAIRDGVLKKPATCERCHEEKPVNGHHESYYKPLEVTWLCDDCHGLRHREINLLALEDAAQ